MDYLIRTAQNLAEQAQCPLAFPITKRIAYIVSHGQSYASNGYAIRSQVIAKALNEEGFETLCLVRPGRPWELGAKNTVSVHEIVNGVRYIHTNWLDFPQPKTEKEHLEACFKVFVELFKVFKPEVVLAASDYKVGLPAWIAAKRSGLPFYSEVRGFWEISRSASETGYAQTPEFKAQAERDTFVANQAIKVFTLNQSMKAELSKRLVPQEKIEIVGNGVSELPIIKQSDSLLKQKFGIQEYDKVVGYVGSFNAYEGLDILLEACAELVQKGEKIKLLLVGDDQPLTVVNTTEVIAAYKGLAHKWEKVPWLVQVGRVPHEQVADYYALIDVVVIPRKKMPVCELVTPIKIVEALAYGKRLLVSDVAPLVEYAANHESVVTFKAGNADSLESRIKEVLSAAMPDVPPSKMLVMSEQVRALVKAFSAQSKEPKQTKKSVATAPSDEILRIGPHSLKLIGNSKQDVAEISVLSFPGATLELSAAIVYHLQSAHISRKAVVLFDFLGVSGKKKEYVPGIGIAEAFKQHFRYLNSNSKTIEDTAQEVFKLKLPEDVAGVRIALASLGLKPNEHIDIRILGRCYSEEAVLESKRQLLMRQPLPAAIVHDPKQKRYTSDITVACVLDEFTAECLSHEVNLVKVTQEAWQSQIDSCFPDFLLVESCWKGNDGNWGAITKNSGGGKKLNGLLSYCKQHGIPTVFWNKEDPPHYDKFGPIAKLFDLAITTDENMVVRYKSDFGIDVYPLSFAAQPKIHNPKPVIPRMKKAVFAGSYYSDKPKRCADFNEVMGQLEQAMVQYDIFDRNYQRNIEKFAFPDHYQPNIVGNLSPEEVWKAHKGYKYQVNMNSVQDSATMFARRVYESLASGTPVISNDSVGVRELFGDVVIMSSEQKSIAEQLRELEASPAAYNEMAHCGVRAVMREHTYGHRIQALCRFLGIEVEISLPKATLVFKACNEAEVQRAKQLFAAQTAPGKNLFIELENFDTAYKLLNESSDTITYAMQLAHDFYTDEHQFYGSDKILKRNVNDDLPVEELEDFIYWGEV